jgi:glycosyltransferase involved in cell wall biosynthesis
MNSLPFFSVIIPVYNAEENLAITVKSVIAQTYTDWELLLIDDGSEDNSLKIAHNFASNDSRIICLRHESGLNKGVSSTRNLGIKYSRGEWIAFLDADDIWHKNKLENQHRIINSGFQDLVFIYCSAVVFDEKTIDLDNLSSSVQKRYRKAYGAGNPGLSVNPFKWIISKGFEAPTSSVAVNKKAIEKYGIYFREHLTFIEDTLFWYEIIQYGNTYFIDQSLVGYRIHNTQWNSSVNRELKLGRRFLIYSEMLKSKFKKEYTDRISFLMVSKGFRIIIVYYLSPDSFSLPGLLKYLKEMLGSELKNFFKIFSLFVLLTEFVLMPVRWIKLNVSGK